MNVSSVCGDGDGSGRRQSDAEIGAGTFDGGNVQAQGRGCGIGIELRRELLGPSVGFGVRTRVDLFVDLNVDLLIVAGSCDHHVAAGVVDGKAGAGGKSLGEGLIALVFIAPELIHVVGVQVEGAAERAIVKAAEDHSHQTDEQKKGEDSTAEGASAEEGFVAVKVPVPSPFDEHDDASADEKERPPSPIPAPEHAGGDVPGLNEKEGNAGGDDQQRADDGGATICTKLSAIRGLLGAEILPLRSRLLAHETTLITPVSLRRRVLTRWWRIGRGLVCHGRSAPFLIG